MNVAGSATSLIPQHLSYQPAMQISMEMRIGRLEPACISIYIGRRLDSRDELQTIEEGQKVLEKSGFDTNPLIGQ